MTWCGFVVFGVFPLVYRVGSWDVCFLLALVCVVLVVRTAGSRAVLVVLVVTLVVLVVMLRVQPLVVV